MTKRAHTLTPSLPKAQHGQGWVALWQTEEERNEYGRRLRPAMLHLALCQLSAHSRIGLGNIRLTLTSIDVRDDGSQLAESVAMSTGMGRELQWNCNRELVEKLLSSTPAYVSVREQADALAHLINDLDMLTIMPLKRLGGCVGTEWYHCAVPHESQYGWCYLPKGVAPSLPSLEAAELPHFMADTHRVVDVLKAKHRIMRELGFESAIEQDNVSIARSLKLRNAA